METYIVPTLLASEIFTSFAWFLVTTSLPFRGGHGGLRYCGIRVFFMRYFGNINFNVRYCCIIYNVAPDGGGGGYCHIWAIWVCAAVKGMVFKQITLG